MGGLIGGGTPPGTVDPFSLGALQNAFGSADTAMHNRYTQLGLGVPSGSPQQAAASHSNLSYAGMGTPEAMDRSFAPSLVGGLGAEAQAALGEMQQNALSASSPSGGGKGGGGLGGLGSLAMLGGK